MRELRNRKSRNQKKGGAVYMMRIAKRLMKKAPKILGHMIFVALALVGALKIVLQYWEPVSNAIFGVLGYVFGSNPAILLLAFTIYVVVVANKEEKNK